MYNIRQDTKSARSMTALRDALVRCMRAKGFHDISVSELCRVAGVSRVTFYRFFSTTTDVLEYLCDSVFEEAARDFRNVDRDRRHEYLMFLLDYLMKRSDLLDAVYRSRRIDLFQKSLSRYVDRYVPSISRNMSPEDADYFRAAAAAAFSSIVFVWVEHGKKDTPERLIGIFRDTLKGL